MGYAKNIDKAMRQAGERGIPTKDVNEITNDRWHHVNDLHDIQRRRRSKPMESLIILIEEIKTALREYVREIVREEVSAALNVGAHELTVKYRLRSKHRPHDILTYTRPKLLQFKGRDYLLTTWKQLPRKLAEIEGCDDPKTPDPGADRCWEDALKLLDKCGYTLGTVQYRQLDENVKSVSISLTTKSEDNEE